MRHSGISSLGDVPWGTHFCQFYQDKRDLIDILVPYFKAGLENNEMCLWVTPELFPAEEAKAALAGAIRGVEEFIRYGQLEISGSGQWFTSDSGFDSDRVWGRFMDRLDTSKKRGFEGLRVYGNPVWGDKSIRQAVAALEAAADGVIGQYRMLALCTYRVGRCNASEILDLASNHAFALIKRGGKWQVIESAKRHLAEVSLRQSEERLRMAVASTGLGTWDFYPTTGKLFWSDLCKGHFGLSPRTEVNYETFLRGLHPDDRDRIHQMMQNALRPESGGHYVAEYRTIGIEDGQERWIASIGRAYFDGGGRPERFIGTTFDLTERKRIEEALRESEELVRLVSDNLPRGMVYQLDFGEDGSSRTFTYVSAGVEQLHGITASEAMRDASTIYGQIHEEDRPMLAELEAKSAAAMSTFQCEFRVRRPCGDINWRRVTSSPRKDARNHLVWDGLEIDITERKRDEEALRASEARERERAAELGAVLEAAPVAMFIAQDPEGRQIVGSRMTYDMLGLPPGSNVSESAPEAQKRTILRAVRTGREITREDLPAQRAAKTGEAVRNYEFDLVYEDGTRRNMLGDAVPVFDERGHPSGAVGAFVDITERKRSEERFRQSQKLESVGRLAGGIAHDFNNLLTAIIGNASMVLDAVDPDSAKPIKEVITAAERAANLTRQLLAYSGKGQFIVRDLDVSQAVNEITSLVEFSIPKSVRLGLNLQRRLPIVRMDPGQLQQVLLNLAINAGEAIGEVNPGEITIATSMLDVEKPFADANGEDVAPGRYVCIDVSDTGSGIDEESKPKIFDPFFTTKFPGRGLGLAAVAGILRSLKGAITLDSAPGCGSRFRVFLPAAEGYMRESREQPVAGERGTILVVDDEASVRDFIGAVLHRQKYRILLASDGREALSVCDREPGSIDAVVLDVVMPLMGAAELLQKIKARQPQMKILLTSGYSEAEVRRLCDAHQRLAFIQKPYTAQRIAEAVEEVLSAEDAPS